MSTPFYDLASLVVVPSGYKSGKIYAQKPLTTDGQLTFSRASTATRVNAADSLKPLRATYRVWITRAPPAGRAYFWNPSGRIPFFKVRITRTQFGKKAK
jgi:hypothetical protein